MESSLRFAGLLSPENTVVSPATVTGQSPPPSPPKDGEDDEDETEETQKHTLYLDRKKQRKFTMIAPISVNAAELKRICDWLKVAMIVDDEPQTSGNELDKY